MTDTRVYHGLGRQMRTWEIVDRNANAVVWQATTVNSTPDKFIILRASAAVKIKVRFA